MKTFAQFIEMWHGDWEPEQIPEKKYSDKKSNIKYNLPTGVLLDDPKSKNSLRIDFVRNVTPTPSYLRLYIPFGKQHVYKTGKEAKVVAMNIISSEKDNYNSVVVYNMNVRSGRSIFSDYNDNLYFINGY